ncbi:MAG TPA: hypothetical protein VHO90_16890, partial [Bacteroidales bacterium]|nr:hypothetical protein [Bacteroidales bacterium]
RTGLNKGDIQFALSEFSESIVFFGKQGQGVKLDGLGTYLPNIDTKGVLSIEHRTDTQIKNVMNMKGAYLGDITNRDNIGKTSAELIAMWNTKHPDDKVV